MKLKDLEKAIPFETDMINGAGNSYTYIGIAKDKRIYFIGRSSHIESLCHWEFKPGTPLKEGLSLIEAVNSGKDWKRINNKIWIEGGSDPHLTGLVKCSDAIATDYILKPDEPEKKTRVFYEWINTDGEIESFLMTKDLKHINGSHCAASDMFLKWTNREFPIEVNW